MITLDEAKLHCRIDGNDDDTFVSGLIAAAEDFVASQTGLDFSEDAETPPPERARHLLKLLIGDWYQNREATVSGSFTETRAATLLMSSLRRHSLGVRPLVDEEDASA